MKKVMRWRYYCEFCKKSGGSRYHIENHEKHCTMNPNRVCGMCGRCGDLDELIAILPSADQCREARTLDEIVESPESCTEIAINKIMPQLRTAADDCPACILATLRQAKTILIDIYVPAISSFNFTEECKEWWKDHDVDRHDY